MAARFKVTQSAPECSVKGNESVDLDLSIKNLSDRVDLYTLSIKGIDPRWYDMPKASVSLFPKDHDTLKIIFKPPLSPEALATDHTIKITVSSREFPDSPYETSFNLKILPFFAFDATLSPDKLSTRGVANLHLDIENKGNAPQSYNFRAEDRERALDYRFAPEKLGLKPGSTGTVSLEVRQKQKHFFGSKRNYEPSIKVVPQEQRNALKSFTPQLTFKPKIHWWLLFLLLFLLLAGIVTALFMLITPPKIRSFTARPMQVNSGEAVELTWDAPGAQWVEIKSVQAMQVIKKTRDPVGTFITHPATTTTYEITAKRFGRTSVPKRVKVTVGLNVVYFKAKWGGFTGKEIKIPPGRKFTIQWDVKGAREVSIDPEVGTQKPSGSFALTATEDRDYTLTARNAKESVTRYVKITILNKPVIQSFDLTPGRVRPGEKVTLSWRVSGVNKVQLKGLPQGSKKFNAVGSTTFKATRAQTFVLEAENLAGKDTLSRSVELFDQPMPPLIAYFDAQPQTVKAGQPVTLSWKVLRVKGVHLKGIGKNLPYESEKVVYPKKSITYVLSASNKIGTKSAKVAVRVTPRPVSLPAKPAPLPPPKPAPPKPKPLPPPEIVTYRAAPAQIKPGQKATIEWAVKGAQRVDIQGIGEDVGQKGRWVVGPLKTTSYVLTAIGARGQKTTQNLLVEVKQPVKPRIQSFKAVPQKIKPGGSVELHWQVSGAQQVQLEGIGQVPPKGSRTFTLDKSTTYTISARGHGNAEVHQSIHVEVTSPAPPPPAKPRIAVFSLSPEKIDAGGKATLTWEVENAGRIDLYWQSAAGLQKHKRLAEPAGRLKISPDSTTVYTLEIKDAENKIRDRKELRLTVAQELRPPIIEVFSANPDTLLAFNGESTVIRWKVIGADSVRIEPGIGPVPNAGSVTKKLNFPDKKIYTLTARNKNGEVQKEIVVHVSLIK